MLQSDNIFYFLFQKVRKNLLDDLIIQVAVKIGSELKLQAGHSVCLLILFLVDRFPTQTPSVNFFFFFLLLLENNQI